MPRLRFLAVLTFLFGTLLLDAPRSAADVPRLLGTVTRVIDGDTLEVKLASGPIRVRLYGIDAPESAQPQGPQAKAALSRLVGQREVALQPFSQDRYDRMIARVYVGRHDVNAELISQGAAWVYRRYLQKTDASWCSLEQRAREAKRGLWAADAAYWLPPWIWRHRRYHPDYGGAADGAPFTESACIEQIGKGAG